MGQLLNDSANVEKVFFLYVNQKVWFSTHPKTINCVGLGACLFQLCTYVGYLICNSTRFIHLNRIPRQSASDADTNGNYFATD